MHKMIENMHFLWVLTYFFWVLTYEIKYAIFLGFNKFRTYLTQFDNIYEFVYIKLLKLVHIHMFLFIRT